MDTNLAKIVIDLLANQPPPSSSNNTVLIVTIICASLASTLTAVAAFIQSRASKTTAEKTSETVKEVHTAVNSERTAMVQKLEDLTAEILRLHGDKKTLEEQKRGADVATALKDKSG